MRLVVNGEFIGNLKGYPRTRDKALTISFPITLKQGYNTIRLYNATDPMPEIDFISIEPKK